jgi:hypothetical protein
VGKQGEGGRVFGIGLFGIQTCGREVEAAGWVELRSGFSDFVSGAKDFRFHK